LEVYKEYRKKQKAESRMGIQRRGVLLPRSRKRAYQEGSRRDQGGYTHAEDSRKSKRRERERGTYPRS
jgi:hypothetical protein